MSHPEILFVDDSEDVLTVAAAILREAGYQVLPAFSGDVAVILLEQGLPFALLVTDIVMPGFHDGFALARRARDLRPDIRLLYTTGFAEIAGIRARGAPFGEMLAKPWGARELLAAVGTVLPRAGLAAPPARLPVRQRPPTPAPARAAPKLILS